MTRVLKMKKRLFKIFTLSLFMIIVSCSSTKETANEYPNPKINRENYYDFYSTTNPYPVTTNWLRRNEVVPIIMEEFNKLGKNNFSYELYELPDSNRIIIDVYNRD